MLKAELYKIRHHRTPYVLTAFGVLAAAAPAVYFAFRPPEEVVIYGEGALGALIVYGLLAGSIFGGWLLGHEYRQETLRRVVAVDARRGRILATKAAAGLGVFTAMMSVMLAVGLGAAQIAAAVNGDALVTTGLAGDIAGALLPGVVAAALAFALSAVLRSDTYATLTTLGALVVFAPLLAIIPNVGAYMPMSATQDISFWLSESTTPDKGLLTMVVTLGIWIGVSTLAGKQVFARRDI